MTAKIFRRRSEPTGSIIEVEYSSSQFPCPQAANEDRCSALSNPSLGETVVNTLLAKRRKAPAIADRLEVNATAVKEHIKSVLHKLKTRTYPSKPDRPTSK